MPVCTRCNGEGYETYDEDGRTVTDACYHCGTTGTVDPEIDFEDKVRRFARSLAYDYITELRKARNEDPEGDGWDLCAAESGLSSYDYFELMVTEREITFAEDLLKLSHTLLDFLMDKFNRDHDTVLELRKLSSSKDVTEDRVKTLNEDSPGEVKTYSDFDIPF
jgi:hypothetical protein